MSTVAPCVIDAIKTSPEHRYHATSDPKERERIRVEILLENTAAVAALVRKQAKGRDTAEAVNVGVLELFEALEDFDPTRGTRLWTYALPRVRARIADWAVCELGAKRSHKRADDPAERRAKLRRRPESFNEVLHEDPDREPEDPELLLMELQREELGLRFLSYLSDDDCRTFVPTVGRPKKDFAERNKALRERAVAFMKRKS